MMRETNSGERAQEIILLDSFPLFSTKNPRIAEVYSPYIPQRTKPLLAWQEEIFRGDYNRGGSVKQFYQKWELDSTCNLEKDSVWSICDNVINVTSGLPCNVDRTNVTLESVPENTRNGENTGDLAREYGLSRVSIHLVLICMFELAAVEPWS